MKLSMKELIDIGYLSIERVRLMTKMNREKIEKEKMLGKYKETYSRIGKAMDSGEYSITIYNDHSYDEVIEHLKSEGFKVEEIKIKDTDGEVIVYEISWNEEESVKSDNG